MKNAYFHSINFVEKGYFRSTIPARISHAGKQISFSLSKSCPVDSITKEETGDSPDNQEYYYVFARWNNPVDSAMKLRAYLLKRKEQYLNTGLYFDELLSYLNDSKEERNVIIDEADFSILVYRTAKFYRITYQAEKYIWDILDNGKTELSLPNSENWNFCSRLFWSTKKEVSDLINKFKYKFVASFKVTYTGAEVGRKLTFIESNNLPKLDITCKAVELQVDRFNRSQSKWILKSFNVKLADIKLFNINNRWCRYHLNIKNLDLRYILKYKEIF